MKIGIILHPYGEEHPGGLPRIIYGWAEALMSVDGENEYIIYLKEKPDIMPTFLGRARVVVLGVGPFWLNRLRRVEQADVYLFNTPVLPLFWKPKRALVIVLDYPYKYLKAKNVRERVFRLFISIYHRYSLARADHIIAVSNATKEDTLRFFGVPKEKISVVYHGFKKICELPEMEVTLPEHFFFFAGTMKERKNVLNIIKAFELFLKNNPQAPEMLVLAGKNEGPYYNMILEYIEKHSIKKVFFVGHLNEEQLSFAYKRARALVFPSIVEGTGFPVLEATGCSVPVVTSNIFGPAELGANGGAILINPYHPEEIRAALEKITSDPDFRAAQIERGRIQAARFSWTNTGQETLALIKRLFDEKK